MLNNFESNAQSKLNSSADASQTVAKSQKKQVKEIPTLNELEKELLRERYRYRYISIIKNTVYSIITLIALAAVVAALWLPVLEIYGTSMTPGLQDGDVVVSSKTSDFKQGDIVAFYYNNQVLVKRVIATSGERINITEDGKVYVNGKGVYEPYVDDFDLGDCNIEMPFQVPEGKMFVMGDNRSVSLDSRNTAIGCVAQEQVVGKIVFRIWPLSEIKKLG